MARKVRAAFDPKAFLSTVDHGRTLSSVARHAVVSRQSAPAECGVLHPEKQIKIVGPRPAGGHMCCGVVRRLERIALVSTRRHGDDATPASMRLPCAS